MALNKDYRNPGDPVCSFSHGNGLQYSEAVMEFREQFFNMMKKEEYSFEKFYLAANRMATFKAWPKCHKLSPKTLCEAGFLYVGFDDVCMCPWCEIIIDHLSSFEDPLVKHRLKAKTSCRYLNYIFPLPLMTEGSQQSEVSSTTSVGEDVVDNAF